ncbi:MAG: DUF2723 domain-containing protein [Candidatus Eisenbacteria bacterium]
MIQGSESRDRHGRLLGISTLRSLLFGAVVLLFYLATLAPSVPAGDGGELVTAASLLGVAHPPGYPLYTLLGKIALSIPAGSPAARMNVLSALFAAAAAALLYRAVARVTGSDFAALFGGALFAFAPTFHAQATAAEVYAPAIFLFLLAPTLLLGEGMRGRVGGAYGAGLAAAHHPIGLFYLPFLAILALIRKGTGKRMMVAMAVLFLVAITVIAYLPIRARSGVPLRWGNPDTIGGAIGHVLRLPYGDLPGMAGPAEGGASFAEKTRIGAGLLAEEIGIAGIFLGLLGAGLLLMRWRGRGALLAAAIVAGFLGTLAAVDLRPTVPSVASNRIFLLPVAALLAGAAGVGLHGLVRAARARWLAPLLVIVIAGPRLAAEFPGPRRGDHIADDLARSYLADLPPDATLHTVEGHLLFPLLYVQQVEGYRPDVRIEAPKDVWRTPPGERLPLFFTTWEAAGGTPVSPQGIALYAAPPGKQLMWRDEWDRIGLRAPPPERIGATEREVLFGFRLHYARCLAAAGRQARAREELAEAAFLAPRAEEGPLHLARGYHQAGFPEEALRIYREIAAEDPEEWRSRLFAGVILDETGRPAEARAAFEEVRRIAPDRPEGHLYLAHQLLRAGDREGAARAAAAGVRIAPEHPLARAFR